MPAPAVALSLGERSGDQITVTAPGVEQQQRHDRHAHRPALHPSSHGIKAPAPTVSQCADLAHAGASVLPA
jgi:hypothetical protein